MTLRPARQGILGALGGSAALDALSHAMPTAYFDRLGLLSYAAHPELDPTEPPCTDRTHGGVTGKASDRLPMSIAGPSDASAR
jgi:hypothetical protein